MNFFEKAIDFLGGGLVKTVAETVTRYFPPGMTPQEQADLQKELAEIEHRRTIEAAKWAHEADREFNRRLRDMEGTAADLKAVPVIGHVLILLRGAQRPAWGIGALWIDFQVFSGSWKIGEGQESVLLAINLLVLGFLFGERAVRNVAPLLDRYFGRQSGNIQGE